MNTADLFKPNAEKLNEAARAEPAAFAEKNQFSGENCAATDKSLLCRNGSKNQILVNVPALHAACREMRREFCSINFLSNYAKC